MPPSQREGDRLRWKESFDRRLRCNEMSLKYNGDYIPLAKALRKKATKEENHLWYDYLSKYPVRFQRQKVIDEFIADFYCHKAKLVIEIDGSQHFTSDGKRKDEFRTSILEGYDLKVIRFTNFRIDENFEGVCKYIDLIVKREITEELPHPTLSGAPSRKEP